MKYLTVYDIIKKRPDFKQQPVQLITVNLTSVHYTTKCVVFLLLRLVDSWKLFLSN